MGLPLVALVLSSLAMLSLKLRARNTGVPVWFELKPRSPEIDPSGSVRAISAVKKGRRPGRLIVARRGLGSESVVTYLGIAGAADPEGAAKSLCSTAGSQPSRIKTAPNVTSGLRWWRSYPVLSAENSKTLDKLARDPQEVEHCDTSGFADHVNAMLTTEDWLVIEAAPARDGRAVHATAMTTSETLSTTWTDFANVELSARRPRWHWAWVLAMFAVTLAALNIYLVTRSGAGDAPVDLSVAGVEQADDSVDDSWEPPGWLQITLSLAAAGIAVRTIMQSRHYSPDLVSIESGCRVQQPTQRAGALIHMMMGMRKKGEDDAPRVRLLHAPLPSAETSGWLAAGSNTSERSADRYAPEAVVKPPPDSQHGNGPAGVIVGHDLDEREVWIADRDRSNAIVAFGDPGFGKTTLLLNVLHGDAQHRAAGAKITPIWIEVKETAGAERADRVMQLGGLNGATGALTLTGAEATGVMLDLIDWTTPMASAQSITSAFRYAFDKGDIYERSRDIIESALAAVIAAPPEALRALGYNVGRPNVIRESLALIGGSPVERPREWVLEKLALAPTPEYDSFLQWAPRKGGYSKHQLDTMLTAPVSKLSGIASAQGIWSYTTPDGQGRPVTTFRSLLETHTPTILHLAPPEAGAAYDKIVARRMASIVMYMLFQAIQRTCDGWQAQGRFTAIYCDELRALAGSDDNDIGVINEMLDTGRSFGVRPVLATQRPNQVDFRTREALGSSGSKVYFHLEDIDAAQHASEDLEEAYTSAEIRALQVGHGAARIARDGLPNAAFTLHPVNISDHLYAKGAGRHA